MANKKRKPGKQLVLVTSEPNWIAEAVRDSQWHMWEAFKTFERAGLSPHVAKTAFLEAMATTLNDIREYQEESAE
jgi:uncharacterized SAM-binding protein YcdF (DUF218 family)